MSKAISKAVTSVAKALTSKPKPKRKPSRKASRSQRRARNTPIPGILAGYGDAVTSRFQVIHRRDGCVLRGVDLITPNWFNLTYNIVSFYMPANPLAWPGTRARAVAKGFQNYRPVKFKIIYRPQTGSTSNSSLFLGTVWQNNSVNSMASIEPSLVTSPGGCYSPAWQFVDTPVPLGDRLPQRMYPMRSNNWSLNPFSVVARASTGGPASTASSLIGRVFFEYEFLLSNAIGADDLDFGSFVNHVLGVSPVSIVAGGVTEWAWALRSADQPIQGVIVNMDYRLIANGVPIFANIHWEGIPNQAGALIYVLNDETGRVPCLLENPATEYMMSVMCYQRSRTVPLDLEDVSKAPRSHDQPVVCTSSSHSSSSSISSSAATENLPTAPPSSSDDDDHPVLKASRGLADLIRRAIRLSEHGPVEIVKDPISGDAVAQMRCAPSLDETAAPELRPIGQVLRPLCPDDLAAKV